MNIQHQGTLAWGRTELKSELDFIMNIPGIARIVVER